jgi:hypothetical protein
VCKEKPPFGNILAPDFVAGFRSAAFVTETRQVTDRCTLGCFYGEYREPMYVVRDRSVLWEWTTSYLRNYRFGMRAKGGALAPDGDGVLLDPTPQSSVAPSPTTIEVGMPKKE